MNIEIKKVKIVVTVPLENLDKVRDAMSAAGAGVIGNYSDCSMVTKCIGSFKPNDTANPYIGEKNKMEFVKEEKLEMVCNFSNVKKVLSELRKNHPYEEPAIDIIPLLDEKMFL